MFHDCGLFLNVYVLPFSVINDDDDYCGRHGKYAKQLEIGLFHMHVFAFMLFGRHKVCSR